MQRATAFHRCIKMCNYENLICAAAVLLQPHFYRGYARVNASVLLPSRVYGSHSRHEKEKWMLLLFPDGAAKSYAQIRLQALAE